MVEYIRKSAKSANLQYRRRVPLDLQKQLGGKEWVEQSLGTPDPREAKKRAAMLTAQLEQQWDSLRGGSELQRWRQGVEWLSQREPLRLDGEEEGEGGPDHAWASDEFNRVESGKAKLPNGATPEAYVAWLRGEHTVRPPTVTLKDALKVWLDERRPTESVRSGAARVVEQFSASVGDAPMASVTRSQARRYRDSLVAAGTAPGSIATYLAYLRTVFEHAIKEELIAERVNPFAALKVERDKAAEEDRLPIPREVCMAILKESLAPGFDQSDWFAAAMLTAGGRPGGVFKAKLVLDAKVPYWQIPREKKSPPRAVPVHPLLLRALDGREPPRYTVRAEQVRRHFIDRHKPYTAYQCRHSFNDEARRVDMPLELRLRLMGQSARKVIGENARYGSLEAVLSSAPEWIEKMWT